MYVISHCFIWRPSDSTMSEDAGIEPRTVADSALAARCSNHSPRLHPWLRFSTKFDLIGSSTDLRFLYLYHSSVHSLLVHRQLAKQRRVPSPTVTSPMNCPFTKRPFINRPLTNYPFANRPFANRPLANRVPSPTVPSPTVPSSTVPSPTVPSPTVPKKWIFLSAAHFREYIRHVMPLQKKFLSSQSHMR
jgi:hypothetical protein